MILKIKQNKTKDVDKVNKASNGAQPTPIKLNIAKPNQAVIEEKLQSTEPKKITLKIAQQPQSPQQAIQTLPSVAEQQHMSQANYSKFKDQREHVYRIPDTYIGNSVQSDREERVLDLETSLFKKTNIRVPEGVERLFIKILSNAGDNSARSLLKGIDPREILITMTESTITVFLIFYLLNKKYLLFYNFQNRLYWRFSLGSYFCENIYRLKFWIPVISIVEQITYR